MRVKRATTLRSRLTIWYVSVLGVLLLVYAVTVFVFQYAALTRQLLHDEVQDVVTVEGLLYFDGQGRLLLKQDYYSRPQSHLLVDRMMEVRDANSDIVLYQSPTLHDRELGGPLLAGEGGQDFSERLIRLVDGTHVFMVSHVHSLDGKQLVIRLGYDLKPFRQRLLQFCFLLLLGVPVALALAALFGQMIAKRALRPLEDMTSRAEGITAMNLHDRLEIVNTEDELGQMARVFNQLLQRLEEAFSQLKRFTADAAHELRTPLASLRAIGEVSLQSPRTAEEYRGTLSDILEETGRLSETIDSLLLLSRAETLRPDETPSSFPLHPLVQEVLSLLEVLMEERSIRVVGERNFSGNDSVSGERSLLRVVVLNVLHNAVKFSPKNSAIRISYVPIGGSPARLRMSVHDEGPGIPAGEAELVFERFFTSASTERGQTGAGLGLAIARLIVNRSGGSIYFETTEPHGATCIVEFPLIAP